MHELDLKQLPISSDVIREFLFSNRRFVSIDLMHLVDCCGRSDFRETFSLNFYVKSKLGVAMEALFHNKFIEKKMSPVGHLLRLQQPVKNRL